MQPDIQIMSFRQKGRPQPLVFAPIGNNHIDFVQFQDFDKSLFRVYFNDPNKPLSFLIEAYLKRKNQVKEKSNLYFKHKKNETYYDQTRTIGSLIKHFNQKNITITDQSPSEDEMAIMYIEDDYYNQHTYKNNSQGKLVKLKITGHIYDEKQNYKSINRQYQVLDTDPIGHVKALIEKQQKISSQRIRIVNKGIIVQNRTEVGELLQDMKKGQIIHFFQQFKQKREGDFRLKIKINGQQGQVFDIVDIKKDDQLIQVYNLSIKYLNQQIQRYQMVYRGQILNIQKRITDYGISKNQLIELYPKNKKIPEFKGEKDQVFVTIKISDNDLFKVPWRQLKSRTVKQFLIEFITGYKYKKQINQSWCLKYGEAILNPEDHLKVLEKDIKPDITIEVLRNDRYFYFRKMGKHPKIPKKYQQTIKNDIKIRNRSQTIKKTIVRHKKYSQQEKKQLSNDQFITPINIYTGTGYKQINAALRDTNHTITSEQTDFSYCITNGLRKLPKQLSIMVHRGEADYYHGRNNYLQINKLTCFSSFTSTSKDIKVSKFYMGIDNELEQAQVGGTLFHITCLTGKSVQDFSQYEDEYEVLFPPYTYFVVDKIVCHSIVDQIWLTEVPSPSFQKSRIVLWVDDNPENNKNMIKQIETKYQDIQVLQVTSTRIANLWMEEFNHLIQFLGLSLKVVSDMVRYQPIFEEVDKLTFQFKTVPNFTAGAQLLRDFNNLHGYTTKILIFTSNRESAIKQINKLNIRDKKVWEVAVEQDRVFNFCVSQMKKKQIAINQKVPNNQQKGNAVVSQKQKKVPNNQQKGNAVVSQKQKKVPNNQEKGCMVV